MMYYDPRTGLPVADAEIEPLEVSWFPTQKEVEDAFSTLILSASGWRKVFAASGLEEDDSPQLTIPDRIISASMAYVYGRYLQEKTGKTDPLIVMGLDSRPTAPQMADVMGRIFLSMGIQVQYLFICAAPEIMAYSKVQGTIDGFAYISASHNPVGHNGVKFGLNTGGVLSAAQVNPLIDALRSLIISGEWTTEFTPLLSKSVAKKWGKELENMPSHKKDAEKAYWDFTLSVVTGLDSPKEARKIWHLWSELFKKTPLGTLSEFNGSARCLSIDSAILAQAGVGNIRLNDKPRQFVHRIVPEGKSLELCRQELENTWKKDPSFLFGYVPDCDGDRGNLVYMDEKAGVARILEAQEVFALAVLSELAYSQYLGTRGFLKSKKTAVVVNDATSRRIEVIAQALGAEVYRCEVGEANVVGCAEELRTRGWEVRVLGEGSNGGNILHPAAVRDPLNTLFSFIKLMNLRSDPHGPGLFEIWCKALGTPYNPNFSLKDVMDTLPPYITTSAYEPEALLKIQSPDHAQLKKNYEQLFLLDWENRRENLKNLWNVVSYRQINYEGTQAKEGWGSTFRSGKQRGGFKIEFLDDQGVVVAFNWMRGSGTEPVFRILTDAAGSHLKKEAWFREWHTDLVLRADAL